MSHTTAPDHQTHERSGWAIGWITFAGTLMILVGCLHAFVGLVGIVDDELYVVTPNYILELDTTTWGWVHLVLCVVVAAAGVFLFSGNVAARTVGVVLAGFSVLAAFAWMPYYPVWAFVIIGLAVAVIWALTAHGRDIAGMA
jgi:hypothetical protein